MTSSSSISSSNIFIPTSPPGRSKLGRRRLMSIVGSQNEGSYNSHHSWNESGGSSSSLLSGRHSSSIRSSAASNSQIYSHSNSTIHLNPTGTGSRNSHNCYSAGWNVGLNVEKLERLLCDTIPAYLMAVARAGGNADIDLDMDMNMDDIKDQFRNLAERCREKSDKSREALAEASDWMATFLSSSQSSRSSNNNNKRHSSSSTPPPELTAELHSYIGLIQEIRGDTTAAVQSYTKALWLLHRASLSLANNYLNNNSNEPTLDRHLSKKMAQALYRLGAAYGRLGDYTTMQALTDRAESLQQEVQLVHTLNAVGF